MAEEVKIVDDIDITISASNKTEICFFCNQKFSKYTCPRCNASYCSINCYKSEKHLTCSENFYKESIVQELLSRSKDPKDVGNVLRMLANLDKEQQSLDFEDDDKPSLEDRMASIDLNTADSDVIWDALTQVEKREFEATVKTGSLSHLIEEWIPWWRQPNYDENKADIQVLESADRTNGRKAQKKPASQRASYPKILQNIPTITENAANPLIKYSIMDVVYWYAYTMKLYNGAPEESLTQSVITIYKLSSSLSMNMTFESLEIVVHHLMNSVIDNREVWNPQNFSYEVLLDVSAILAGSTTIGQRTIWFVDCALSEVCRLLVKVKKVLKDDSASEKDVKNFWLAKKKVEFFLSWCQSNRDALSSMVPALKTLHFELVDNYKIHEEEKLKQEGKRKGNNHNHKNLVEEL